MPKAVLLVTALIAIGGLSQTNWRAPIVDRTTAEGMLYPNGEQKAQTVAAIAAGMTTKVAVPECLGSSGVNPAARCATICVSMPPGSKVSKVESFADDLTQKTWLPCDGKRCLGQPVSVAKAMFEPTGHFIEDTGPRTGPRVCWGFRNWHPELLRKGILVVTFRAPR
jgi:hypothetical protein